MRVSNWPIVLAQEISEAQGRAFAWAEWDCCQFGARVVAALRGSDPRSIFPAYTSEREAIRVIAQYGGIEGLISAALGNQKPAGHAMRGDIVLCDFGRGLQPAVCIGAWCVAPGALGLEKRSMNDAVAAWTV